MNDDTIIKLALDSHLLNYVDHETPRYYFVDANAELEDVVNFAYKILTYRELELKSRMIEHPALKIAYDNFITIDNLTKK